MSSKLLLPNTTQIPNAMIDEWMSHLTGSEFKIVMYVARRTYGFGKEEDSISLNQLANGIKRKDGTVLDRGTGLSRSTVADAAKNLEQKKILVRSQHSSETRGDEPTSWKLNLDRIPKSATPPVSRNRTPPVRKSDTQNQEIQNTLQSDTTYPPSGADEPPPPKNAKQKDSPSPSTFSYMNQYSVLLDEALSLSRVERGRMANQIQAALDRGTSDSLIGRALSRMVAKRDEGLRLDFTDVLNDVITGPRRQKSNEPPPVERRQKRMY